MIISDMSIWKFASRVDTAWKVLVIETPLTYAPVQCLREHSGGLT